MAYKKITIGFLLTFVLVFTVKFSNDFFHVMYRNKTRETILSNSVESEGYITHIFSETRTRRNTFSGYAIYEFSVNGLSFTGQTNFDYKGKVGDKICLLYNKANPKENIYCNDSELESYTKKTIPSAFWSAIIFSIFLLMLSSLKFLWKKFTRKPPLLEQSESNYA